MNNNSHLPSSHYQYNNADSRSLNNAEVDESETNINVSF